jgi:[ribosomal protein S5]-alanine N-acetyltransferase
MAPSPVFTTPRLTIRLADAGDAPLFHRLWTDPQVMANVGFPGGIPITLDELRATLAAQPGSEFERLLVVELTVSGEPLGECLLGKPNPAGIASTDVKLLPQFWGHGYGVEVKRGLLDYLFTHTAATAVEATPNVGNLASIRMQEAVGGVRVGETTFTFPAAMQSYTTPVHAFIYHVTRAAWLAQPWRSHDQIG